MSHPSAHPFGFTVKLFISIFSPFLTISTATTLVQATIIYCLYYCRKLQGGLLAFALGSQHSRHSDPVETQVRPCCFSAQSLSKPLHFSPSISQSPSKGLRGSTSYGPLFPLLSQWLPSHWTPCCPSVPHTCQVTTFQPLHLLVPA